MVHWDGKGKYPLEQEKERQRMIKEVEKHHAFRKELQAIKDWMDLFGYENLPEEKRVIVDQRRAFFFPGEG